MIRIISFTDTHLSDKNPISRTDNYKESIFNKLEQIRDICVQRDIDLAICGGDIFHIKTPNKNSHHLVSQLINIFKRFPCPILSIYGNHDVIQNNLNNLPKQPYMTLLNSEACVNLTDTLFKNDIRIFKVDGLLDPSYEDFNRENNGEKIQICVAHVNASSKFDNLFGEKVYTYQELEKTTPNIFIFGHYHPDQGIEIRNERHFINVGSISRGSLKKDELNRIPSLGYIEIDEKFNIKTSKIQLNVLSASDIFDLEMKEKEEKEEEEIEKFIEELKEQKTLSDLDDVGEYIRSLNFEKSILDRALFYFDKAV